MGLHLPAVDIGHVGERPALVFSNLFFLYIFLPANIILYFSVRSPQARNSIMVAFSLFFYAKS